MERDTESHPMKTKHIVALASVLVVAGFAAGALYGSNILRGTITVEEYLGVTGSFPSTLEVGNTTVIPFYVSNYAGVTLSTYVVVTLSKDGIQSSDAIVKIAGNSITPTCISSMCSWQGVPFNLPAGVTERVDISVTLYNGPAYEWSVQAWGTG